MANSAPLFRPAGSQSRPEQKREHDRLRRQKQPWRAWYGLARWRDLRAAQLLRQPLCEVCLAKEPVKLKAADVVHHADPHQGVWEKFFDPENLQSVCKPCHDGEIQRGERAGWSDRGLVAAGAFVPYNVLQPRGLEPSAIALTIVCGAPGAGKTTWVAEQRRADDVVIDIDDILDGLAGDKRRTMERRRQWMAQAFVERNRRLIALSKASVGSAWFVVGAPACEERERWAVMLGAARTVVMATPLPVCLDRIRGDPDRRETRTMIENGALAWWQRYSRSANDFVVV